MQSLALVRTTEANSNQTNTKKQNAHKKTHRNHVTLTFDLS